MKTESITSFSEAERALHKIMHFYFKDDPEYLIWGVLLSEWADENILRIIKGRFPPAVSHRYQ